MQVTLAAGDTIGASTCEMNNIYVDNVILSSDLTGSLVSVSYSGSDAADFEANAFEFFHITDS